MIPATFVAEALHYLLFTPPAKMNRLLMLLFINTFAHYNRGLMKNKSNPNSAYYYSTPFLY